MRRGWLIAALLAGCFDPRLDYSEGSLRCDPHGQCPPGMVCRGDDTCWKTQIDSGPPTSADAARADGRLAPDGSPADASPDGPLVDSGTPIDAPTPIDARPPADASPFDARPAIDGGALGPDACVPIDPCSGMCGSLTDNCGTPVSCGDTCSSQEFGYTCGGAEANVCGCTPSSKWCDGDILKSCNPSGTWDVIQTCPTVCAGGQCGACTPTSEECVDGNTHHLCKGDGTWDVDVDCLAGQICDPADGQCKDCLPGTHQCLSCTQPQTCQDGSWVDDAACTASACDPTGGCVGACFPGDTQCKSSTIQQTCSCSGAWGSDKTCQFVCTGAACGGMCKPGDKTCNGSELQVCDQTGTYQDDTSCGFGCSAGSCNACTPSSKLCSQDGRSCQCSADGKSMTCSAVCANGCNASDGGCCTPTSDPCATHCGGTWSNGCGMVTCPNDCVAPETCGGGGSTNVCGCTRNASSCTGKCDSALDNCGNPCGTTCAAQGHDTCDSHTCCADCSGKCGSVTDACGLSYICPDNCSSIDSHYTCGGGGTPGVCGCTPSDPCSGRCNVDLSDGCGGTVHCANNCPSIDPTYFCGGHDPTFCGCSDTPFASCEGNSVTFCSGGVASSEDCGNQFCCDCGNGVNLGCEFNSATCFADCNGL